MNINYQFQLTEAEAQTLESIREELARKSGRECSTEEAFCNVMKNTQFHIGERLREYKDFLLLMGELK